MRSRIGRLIGTTAVGVILVIAWTTFRIWDVGNRDNRRASDAIVVLGAAQYNGRPSAVFKARLDHAIDLYEAGVAPHLVVTGGKAEGDRTTEAASARAYAIARGVPAAAILVEDRGRTTLESLRGVAVVLREAGLSTAVFVSDRTHMLRVLRIGRDVGIDGVASPTSTSPADADFASRAEATLHELGGLALYFIAGQTP
ncbi:MAG TPA: YdcF family protein [Candidatus Limnocylindrales bacterium]|nr:YdcF family protein [Candidatus Limnocylindrales bacterium]